MAQWTSDPLSWIASVNTTSKVGAKHHIVPRFLLRRWANKAEQLQVFSRDNGQYSQRAVSDVAVRDFYTFIDLNGHSNSTLEELLSRIEEDAAAVIATLTSGYFRAGAPLTPDKRDALDIFVAFQFVRGPRSRRELELLADYYAKSSIEHDVPAAELAKLEVSPHQNEHIRGIGERALNISAALHTRPLSIVRLDRPLLWLSDEPVIVEHDETNNHHHPDCTITDKEIRRRQKAARRNGDDYSVVRHVRTDRQQGVLDASAIAMPLTPNTALVYGPSKTHRDLAVDTHQLAGEAATELARHLNSEVASAALDVIIGRLDDSSFRTTPMPERRPILHICGPRSALDHALNATPNRLRPHRYSNDAPLDDNRTSC